MTPKQLERWISKTVRAKARAVGKSYPIVVLDGFLPPSKAGQKAHYTTLAGSPIDHPNAYSKKGFSNMIYHHSTIRIEVGAGWLTEQLATIYFPTALGFTPDTPIEVVEDWLMESATR